MEVGVRSPLPVALSNLRKHLRINCRDGIITFTEVFLENKKSNSFGKSAAGNIEVDSQLEYARCPRQQRKLKSVCNRGRRVFEGKLRMKGEQSLKGQGVSSQAPVEEYQSRNLHAIQAICVQPRGWAQRTK